MHHKSKYIMLSCYCDGVTPNTFLACCLTASDTCNCYGKSQYCKADHLGLHCINCQGDTEGRQCENCKEGYYHQRAEDDCAPCDCNTVGEIQLLSNI